jgi:type III pantothenate kinase
MQSGIVYGEADRIDGFVGRVFSELGYEAPVVATGGLATTMAPLCRSVTHTNPELTLEGLRLVYEASQG